MSQMQSVKKQRGDMATTSIKTIEEMGYSLEFFQLGSPQKDGQHFQYYTFGGTARPELLDVWEIIGVARPQEMASAITLRLMHIDMDMFEWDNYSALTSAQSRLSLGPAQFRLVLQFFTPLLLKNRGTDDKGRYFYPLSLEELRAIHAPEQWIHGLEGYVYEYRHSEEQNAQQERCLFQFPDWLPRVGSNQVAGLKCVTFKEAELSNPKFCPLYTFGVSTVTFVEAGFAEFIRLLEEHSYEAFLTRRQDQQQK